MARTGLLITLIDPLVATADAASAGRPETLKYVPGAMLLGTIAGRCYDRVADPFQSFHSGDLRFGDGLPIDDEGRLGFPCPLSLHSPKGEKKEWEDLSNLVHTEVGNKQWKQVRGSALSLDCREVKITTINCLKTAIDPTEGRAAQSQLFGFEALPAGSRYWSEVSAETGGLIDEIRGAFPAGDYRMGRSRSAEFGRVRIEWIHAPDTVPLSSTAVDAQTVWALSDVALERTFGAADPLEKLFQCPIDYARSFIRTRTVWPFNGHWRARGLQRTVIERGSVIALETQYQGSGVHYLGSHQEIGCGRVVVAPQFLSDLKPVNGEAICCVKKQLDPETSRPKLTPIFDYFVSVKAASSNAEMRTNNARQALDELNRHYESAAALAGVDAGWAGPSRTQWSAIRALAGSGRIDEQTLFSPQGIAKDGDAEWSSAIGTGQTFQSWLRSQWHATRDDPEQLALIAKGAANAVGTLRDQQRWEPQV